MIFPKIKIKIFSHDLIISNLYHPTHYHELHILNLKDGYVAHETINTTTIDKFINRMRNDGRRRI